MMMSLTNRFTKEDTAAGKGCIETGTASSKWEFKLLCDLATNEKGAIITFAMIQPKIED